MVVGVGKNPYGSFDLRGTLQNNQLRVEKVYRTGRPKPKKPKKSVSVQKVRKPASARERKTPARKFASPAVNTSAANCASTVAQTGGLTQAEILSAQLTPRNRSERKRKIPGWIKEEAQGQGAQPAHMQQCLKILQQLSMQQNAGPFLERVDPVALNIPDYFKVIKNPMDLGTVRRRLEDHLYKSPDEFAAAVRLTFRNAMTYNKKGHLVHDWAVELSNVFERKYAAMMQDLGGFSQAKNAPPKRPGGKQPGKQARPAAKRSKSGNKYPRHHKASDDADQMTVAELQKQVEFMKRQMEEMKHMSMGHPGVGGGRKAPVNDDKRAMTFEEKRELSLNINKLPGDKLNRVLQIISERMPLGQQDPDQEIEIDIGKLDTTTLRHLQRYVKVCCL